MADQEQSMAAYVAQLQQQISGLNARNKAATDALYEATENNIRARAALVLMEAQCKAYKEENERLKAATGNEEIARLNRVVAALDAQLATAMQENDMYARELNAGCCDPDDRSPATEQPDGA